MQEQEQQGSYYHTPMQQYGGSIVLLTDPSDILEEMEMSFRGMQERRGEWVQVGRPLMNDDGISDMMSVVRSIVNRDTIMSLIDKKNLDSTLLDLGDTITEVLMLNRYRYGIQNDAARRMIVTIIMNKSEMCMRRALDKNEKNFWGRVQHDITHTSQVQNQQRRSWINPFSWGNKS